MKNFYVIHDCDGLEFIELLIDYEKIYKINKIIKSLILNNNDKIKKISNIIKKNNIFEVIPEDHNLLSLAYKKINKINEIIKSLTLRNDNKIKKIIKIINISKKNNLDIRYHHYPFVV